MSSAQTLANGAVIPANEALARVDTQIIATGRVVASVFDGPSSQWDSILSGFTDSSLEQSAAYARGRWGSRAKCYLVRREGTVIAGAIVLEFSPPRLRTGLSFLKFGPFWRPKGMDVTQTDFEAVMGAIRHQVCRQEHRCLAVIPRPSPTYNALEASSLRTLGFSVREQSVDPNRYLVDLHLKEEAQRSSLDQKWRYNLRRSIKAGVTVELEDTPDGFAALERMHSDMRSRKGYDTGEPIHMVPELASSLDPSMRPHLYIARHEGRPVAGAVVCAQGDMANYVFGATASDALSLRAGYALQWHIVRDLSLKSDARWYDLGGEAGSPGLKQFKKGLVGRSGEVLEPADEHIFCENPFANMFASTLFTVRALRRSLRLLRKKRGAKA